MTPNLLDELEPVSWLCDAPDDGTRVAVIAKALADMCERHDWKITPLYGAPALADMAKRMEALQYLAAAMYQAAGAYDMPARFLDVLSAAGNGKPITEEQVDALLPCETPDTIQRRDAARYRWLKLRAISFERDEGRTGSPYCVYGLGMGDAEPTYGTELDAMVDDAMTIDAAQEGAG